MTPKPHRNGTSGWLGRRTTRLKSLALAGTATLGLAGLGIAAAGPAAADPATTYVITGSELTQDVMNGFAAAVGNGAIGSWDAVNPVTSAEDEIITPAKTLAGGTFSSCSFARPPDAAGFTQNTLGFIQQGFGSFTAFVKSLFPGTSLAVGPFPPQPGCIDISRSAGAPGSIDARTGDPGSLDTAGNLVYVPFAMDGVYGATGPTTAASFSFTATMASPAVFTATGSSFAADATVVLSGAALPGGFTPGTLYFVVNPSGATFQLAATAGGAAIASTSAGSGTVAAGTTTQCVAATAGCTNVVGGIGTITFAVPATHITQADSFTLANLTALFNCTAQTVNGVTYNPNNPAFLFTATSASPAVFTATSSAFAAGTTVQLSGSALPGGFTAGTTFFVVNPSGATFELAATAGGTPINSTSAGSGTVQAVTAGQQNIDLYVPQFYSNLLNIWGKALTFPVPPNSPPPTCLHQTIVAGPAGGVPVEENDGSAYASDPLGYGPFSIAHWVAQSSGHGTDRRHTAILRTIDGIAPLLANGTMNPNIETNFQREVYNVMQYDRAVDNFTMGGPFDSVLNGLFVSGTLSGGTAASSLCNHIFTIKSFGFLTLPQPHLPDNCGAFTNSLRVQETNIGPM